MVRALAGCSVEHGNAQPATVGFLNPCESGGQLAETPRSGMDYAWQTENRSGKKISAAEHILNGAIYHRPCDALPGFPCARVIKFGVSQLASTSMNDIDSSAQSPCIRNCCLDDDLTCLGCFRSLDEIKEWGLVDRHRRRIILQNASQRREAHRMPGTMRTAPDRIAQ